MTKYATQEYESLLRDKGYSLVAGLDEVGRGALAGPLVVGLVVLPAECSLELADSKLLSAKRRQTLDGEIRDRAIGYGLGWVSHDEIDMIGLSMSLKIAAERAFEELEVPVSRVLLDGKHNFLDQYAELGEPMIGADHVCSCVAAASIIAKVARDEYMHRAHTIEPQYGFNANVGYGSAAHLSALKEHGPGTLHRRGFCGVTTT